MLITMTIPDDVADHLKQYGDLSRFVLEALAIYGFRRHTLSIEQVAQLPGLADEREMSEFLRRHDVAHPLEQSTANPSLP